MIRPRRATRFLSRTEPHARSQDLGVSVDSIARDRGPRLSETQIKADAFYLISLRLSGFSLAGASRLAPLSRLADVEARDQAILDPKDVTDRLVNQHRSLEVAHRLVDLDDDLTIGTG